MPTAAGFDACSEALNSPDARLGLAAGASTTTVYLMAMPEIDGGLVGGASLDPDDFARIIRFAK